MISKNSIDTLLTVTVKTQKPHPLQQQNNMFSHYRNNRVQPDNERRQFENVNKFLSWKCLDDFYFQWGAYFYE